MIKRRWQQKAQNTRARAGALIPAPKAKGKAKAKAAAVGPPPRRPIPEGDLFHPTRRLLVVRQHCRELEFTLSSLPTLFGELGVVRPQKGSDSGIA